MILLCGVQSNAENLNDLKKQVVLFLQLDDEKIDDVEVIHLKNKPLLQLADKLDNLVSCDEQKFSQINRIVFFEESLLSECENPTTSSAHARLCQSILAFPDLLWMPVKPTCIPETFPKNYDQIPNGLFDCFGIRDYVRGLLIQSDDGFAQIRHRNEIGIVLEEETTYALANAYAIYKTGRRAFFLTTHNKAKYVLNNPCFPRWNNEYPEIPIISIEDLDLQFPDWQPKKENKDIKNIMRDRCEIYPTLKKIKDRRVCTLNPDMLQEEDRKANVVTITKPYPGLFSLEDTIKPPQNNDSALEELGTSSHHSAPGIAVAVADILLTRARNILKSGVSPNEFIKGAVLAMEAGELLCSLSPTMSFEALRLQNTLECLFETGFPGCSYHNEAESRISHYENAITGLAEKAKASNKDQKRIRYEWSISLTAELERIYRSAGDFEEAEEYSFALKQYNRKLLSINSKMKIKKKEIRKKFSVMGILDWLITLPIWYLVILVVVLHQVALILKMCFGERYLMFFHSHEGLYGLDLLFRLLVDSMKIFLYSIVTGSVVYRLLRR